GINVGGANNFAAIVSEDEIKVFKKPSELGLSELIKEISPFLQKGRVVVSTSLPINHILAKFELVKTLVLLIPGPGLNYSRYGVVLKGYVNHRGDVVEKIDENEVRRVLDSGSFSNVAIASKFSVRNPRLEEEVKKIVLEKFSEKKVALSYHVGGLNYPARINTTVINAKIKELVSDLTEELKKHIPRFYYLLSDGSISPPERVVENPSELYSSSAVASAFGAIYLTGVKYGVVVNIGGFSTHLIPIEDGKPRFVSNLEVLGKQTLIRSVDMVTIPFGGSSMVVDGKLEAEACKPIAFGGNEFTLTDAMNCMGCEVGDFEASRRAGEKKDYDVVVEQFVSLIAENLREMEAEKIIGAGYLAPHVIPEIAKKAKISYVIPKFCEAVRAIGSAISKVSLTLHARFDTEKGVAIYNGVFEKSPFRVGSIPGSEEIIEVVKKKIVEVAKSFGADDVGEVKVIDFHSFTIVKGDMKRGVIADVTVQIEPGVKEWKKP
ncbi:MAG: hydantoinase/oxoprolinase family protein, partial [Archaeoglobaceae archaeon]